MLRRYSFILIFFCWITGLGWWAKKVESSPKPPETQAAAPRGDYRLDAIEVLDRIVAYEHYYRSVYGHFTHFLNRVGVLIPSGVSSTFEIRVVEAVGDRLLVTAVSEVGGKTADQISIDQDYQIRSNSRLRPL